MKTSLIRSFTMLLFLSVTLSCTELYVYPCQIIGFYWEGKWHEVTYNDSHRIVRLSSPSSKISFYYDEVSRLKAAFIYLNGESSPYYLYEFIQGPYGIIQTDIYFPSALGTMHNRYQYHYSDANTVDYIIWQEFGTDEQLGFEIQYDILYSNGNVKHIKGTSSMIRTDYFGIKYDDKRNPFKALAAFVGNPLFFPIGSHANFPIESETSYDISFLNRLSENNPLYARYQIPNADAQEQYFYYAYENNMPVEIKWEDFAYGNVKVATYAFKLDCKGAKVEP